MQNPKSISNTLLTLVMLLSFNSFGQLSGDTYATAKNSGSAKFIYVYDGIPGFVESRDGKVTGVVADIMRNFETYLKDNKGITVSSEFIYAKDGDFQNFMQDVKSGKGGVFGLSNISISEERMNNFKFSPPYMDNVSLLVSNDKIATLSSMDEISASFNGLKAYTLKGSSYHQRLIEIQAKYLPSLEIVFLSSETEIMEKLAADEKAFAILDVNYYLEILAKKLNIKRHSVGDKKGDRFGIIMPKSSDWEPVIAEFFNSGFIDSSKYSQIITENLGNSARRLLDSFK